MYAPGGATWDDRVAFPWLADNECSECFEIVGHAPGCTRAQPIEQEVPMEIVCKNGDGRPVVAKRGPYALLCQECTDEKKAARTAKKAELVAVDGDLDAELLQRVKDITEPVTLEQVVDTVVFKTREAVEAAIVVAAQEMAAMLRERIADAIRGRE